MSHSSLKFLEDGCIQWKDEEYTGRFSDYKEMANTRSLFRLDNALLNILNPELLRSFDEVFMLTYLFNGQYQKAYLDYFGFDYRVVGVESDANGYRFSDRPDEPPPLDYHDLIHIVDSPKTQCCWGQDLYPVQVMVRQTGV